MGKIKLILFAATVILGISSCKKDGTGTNSTTKPTACFSTSKSSVEIYEGIDFTSCATKAKTYKWTFGDGEESTESNPYHGYSTAGTFTVTQTVYDSLGASASTIKVITVTNPYTKYAGTWTLSESIDGDTPDVYNVTITVGTNGSVTITNFGYYRKQVTLVSDGSGYFYGSPLVDLTDNVTMQATLLFDGSANPYQLSISGTYSSPGSSSDSYVINGQKQ